MEISPQKRTRKEDFSSATLRKTLQSFGEEKLVLRMDVFQKCLTLSPESVWNATVDKLQARLNPFNRNHQQVLRQFMAESEAITLDSNGRLLIPKRYLQKAGIESEVHFIGMNNTIEVWASEKMEKAFMDNEEFAKSLEELMQDNPEI